MPSTSTITSVLKLLQKYHDDLFPALPEPAPEIFAQAALFVALRDHPIHTPAFSPLSPWSSLVSRRFGGDTDERVINLQKDDVSADPVAVHIKPAAPGHFDITVHTPTSSKSFASVAGRLVSPTSVSTTLNDELIQTTIVSQSPPPNLPVSSSPNTMERLHIFSHGIKTILVLRPPKWLLSLGGDVVIGKGTLKAPMPSVVVEVRVKVRDKVQKGQAVVVLESMKTETILRADIAGIVGAVGCKKGEMVEEGKELVVIEENAES
jgi:3-methylcrotonyl-CoA carboxylase alpha subunit